MTCQCPTHPKCIDSRGDKHGRRRRYKCVTCGARWSTIEKAVRPKPAKSLPVKTVTDEGYAARVMARAGV